MTKEDLSKLINECCDDIFDRKEPLANVKARLYYVLKKQLTLTDVSQQRELLKAYTKWLDDKLRDEEELNELIDNYFDSL